MSFTGDIVPGGDTPSKKGSASTGVCVAIVGLGGLGAELLKRLIEARAWRGRPVTAVIAIDYFADAAAREAVSKSLSAVFSRSYVFSWDATKLQSTLDLEKDLTVALGTTTKVDALLITTGMGYHGSTRVTTLVQSDTALQKLLQVNCTGPSLLSQLFASKFMRAPPKGADWAAMSAGFESPVILLMSSYSGMVGLPHRAAYCAAKFALNGFVEGLYADMPYLRIVLFCPTTVDTAFRDNWRKQLGADGEAASAAAPVPKATRKGFADRAFTAVSQGGADLTVKKCVDSIWSSFNHPWTGPGLKYVVIPGFWTELTTWAVRVPLIGDYSRYRVLQKAYSKL
jgi:short-subunit dehydrogenase